MEALRGLTSRTISPSKVLASKLAMSSPTIPSALGNVGRTPGGSVTATALAFPGKEATPGFSEYYVELDAHEPIGIRFAPDEAGRILVADIERGTQAEATRLLAVGDVLKKCSSVFGDELWDAADYSRTMSAIVNRKGKSVAFVLERAPVVAPRRDVLPTGVEQDSNCDPLGTGLVGNVAYAGSGRVGIASFSTETGCLMTPEMTEATRRQQEPQSLAPPAERPQLAAIPRELCSAFLQLESRVRVLDSGVLMCSSPLTPHTLAILCAEHDIGGILSLVQPYEHGSLTSSLHTAAMVAGARRVSIPLDDLHKQALGRCLPTAAAALFRLKAWVGPERRVLVCAADGQEVVVSTVVAAYAHWHCGESLESLHEHPALHQSADLRLIMDMGDLLLAANALVGPGAAGGKMKGPASSSSRGRMSSPGLKLFRVTFSWKHPAKSVRLVGEPVGGWDAMRDMLPTAEGRHTLTLDLPAGIYAFKYVVDGKWLDAADQRYGVDDKGNRNNVVEVLPSTHEPTNQNALSAEQFTSLVRMQAGKLADSLDSLTLLPPSLLGDIRRANSAIRAQQHAATLAAFGGNVASASALIRDPILARPLLLD